METKFFTGKGDSGESRVGDKTVSKSDVLIDFLGGLDEINSWLGFCRAEAEKTFKTKEDELISVPDTIKEIQNSLFIIQAEVAACGFGSGASGATAPVLKEDKTREIEEVIKKIDSVLPKIDKFVISNGSELASRLDVARTIARRVERQAKNYSEEKKLPSNLLQFLNRLSSVLFALARYVNFKLGFQEEHPTYS